MRRSVNNSDILFDFDNYSKSCSYKVGYESEFDAMYAAERQEARHRMLKLDWYRCEYCGKWHLTEVS